MTTPSGAFVNYSYFRNSQASTTRPTGSLINQVRQKTVQYTPVSSDLSAYKLITTFAFNYSTNVTTVTAPDNGHTQYWFNGSSSPALSGLIYEVDYPDDSSLSYTWQQNAPFNAPVNTQANPYVQYQSRKTPDGKISAVSNTVDKNGNLREVDDFDWIATGTALTVSNALRKTTATYYAATYDNDPAATATDNTNAYWSTTAPTYLGAVKSRTVADINSDAVKSSLITSGTVVAARAYTYDNALTTANVQSFLEWDSARGAYGDGTLTVCATGSTGCTTNAIRTSWTYASNGNVLTATDANGNLTQLNYDANNLYPTQVSVGGLRTAAYSFDGASGYLESSSDTDNAITTTYAYDLIGRQIKIEQAATGLDRVTTTSFDDANLLVTTAQDRAATNDQLLVTKAYYDPLGRLRLSVDAAGNNVQTAYFYRT